MKNLINRIKEELKPFFNFLINFEKDFTESMLSNYKLSRIENATDDSGKLKIQSTYNYKSDQTGRVTKDPITNEYIPARYRTFKDSKLIKLLQAELETVKNERDVAMEDLKFYSEKHKN